MSESVNPFLPLGNYIADGEPHQFGNRVFLFGSHDRERGKSFCELGYEIFSAPVDDLSSWTSKGINYQANQDPYFSLGYDKLYAPDCMQGKDGRYYLYYAMAGEGHFTSPIHVAVCSTPDGKYEYYGEVRNKDGSPFKKKITFDPGVINDDGHYRLYFGWSLSLPREHLPKIIERESRNMVLMYVFQKTKEEVEAEEDDVMNAYEVELEEDMLTVKDGPHFIIPGQIRSQSGEFQGHGFFEASSIRKIDGLYFFIYSSLNQHELCYAVSKYPDKEFHYGGVLISNGDIGIDGRKEDDRLMTTGNNHGSLIQVNGNWYITYHRQTHKTTYSRQECVEPIKRNSDGSFQQASMSSMGWLGKPLETKGSYSATIACNITNGKMIHCDRDYSQKHFPNISSEEENRFISEIDDQTRIVYKDFSFQGKTKLQLSLRGKEAGTVSVFVANQKVATMKYEKSDQFIHCSCEFDYTGISSLILLFETAGFCDFRTLTFLK